MLTDFAFRLNLTEKDGVGKQRGLQYAWSFEMYGKIIKKPKNWINNDSSKYLIFFEHQISHDILTVRTFAWQSLKIY